MKLDPLFMATRLFRHRKFEECGKLCNEVLETSPYDQVLGIMVCVGYQDNLNHTYLFTGCLVFEDKVCHRADLC